ncbi:hypothetical protein POVWA2_026330 [Plasmodium ovale wallikeri]|uniref:Uncharacterized protein n=1 Tax=Plasmodium ovale wallikeri TaxID=864142 RepID=A0A1A8YW75_PLAOA|nr:hypothetical protein POVWA1_026330 [Plasmodium ovale wallikeri]SBT35699.1 hypothetical protein POVWA2_026330 [Plasmodium ovale wallikeri]
MFDHYCIERVFSGSVFLRNIDRSSFAKNTHILHRKNGATKIEAKTIAKVGQKMDAKLDTQIGAKMDVKIKLKNQRKNKTER